MLNITTASALILLRSFGNCVQKQLNKGMAAIKKQVIGITIQNRPKLKVLIHRLSIRGDSIKSKQNNLMAFLWPIHREKGLAIGTVKQTGNIAKSISLEFVLESMC